MTTTTIDDLRNQIAEIENRRAILAAERDDVSFAVAEEQSATIAVRDQRAPIWTAARQFSR